MREIEEALQRRLTAITAARPPSMMPLSKPAMTGAEARTEQRRPTYRFGRIVQADRSELRCIIRDMSRNGVRIVLEGCIVLPERVILKVDHTGERKRARVAWQRDRDAGLSFAVEAPFKFNARINSS